ncbi:hypothetical protein C3V43_00465 [Bacteroides heparinolyticus]|uniref:SH3 domain-containing protein n=1 Tax=Bacteroides TaxID=816 RepID=UPI000D03E8C1|nr:MULTISPECIES: SH3 domain-containing protein [Bacteroides]AVM56418.1 hypothetical protein C3V43_00465 [Bacteroides heparinolyticus]
MEKDFIKEKVKNPVVECPFCHKPIEAPLKPDIIFKCPQCQKELITYDKEQEFLREQKAIAAKKAKQQKKAKQNKLILKWGSIAACIILLAYFFHIDSPDMQAVYIVAKDYRAAINEEVEKELVKAARDHDNLRTVELIGSYTIDLKRGDQVKITGDVVRGLPGYYKIQRQSDGASGIIPQNYLKKQEK